MMLPDRFWQMGDALRRWVRGHPRLARVLAAGVRRVPWLRRLVAERYGVYLVPLGTVDANANPGYRGVLPRYLKDLNPRQKRLLDEWQDTGNPRPRP